MELFHIHVLGNHDRLYKNGKSFYIDKDKYNNRMYRRIYNENVSVESSKYQKYVDVLNQIFMSLGMGVVDKRVNPGEVIAVGLDYGFEQEDLINLLKDCKNILCDQAINLRERAMEEYRINNCPNLPSRLHSLFACSEEGLEYWKKNIATTNADMFLIDIEDEPFKSNECLLPLESLCYKDKITSSHNYFHPKETDFNGFNDEYLVQGKVKILKKIDEYRK